MLLLRRNDALDGHLGTTVLSKNNNSESTLPDNFWGLVEMKLVDIDVPNRIVLLFLDPRYKKTITPRAKMTAEKMMRKKKWDSTQVPPIW